MSDEWDIEIGLRIKYIRAILLAVKNETMPPQGCIYALWDLEKHGLITITRRPLYQKEQLTSEGEWWLINHLPEGKWT